MRVMTGGGAGQSTEQTDPRRNVLMVVRVSPAAVIMRQTLEEMMTMRRKKDISI